MSKTPSEKNAQTKNTEGTSVNVPQADQTPDYSDFLSDVGNVGMSEKTQKLLAPQVESISNDVEVLRINAMLRKADAPKQISPLKSAVKSLQATFGFIPESNEKVISTIKALRKATPKATIGQISVALNLYATDGHNQPLVQYPGIDALDELTKG